MKTPAQHRYETKVKRENDNLNNMKFVIIVFVIAALIIGTFLYTLINDIISILSK